MRSRSCGRLGAAPHPGACGGKARQTRCFERETLAGTELHGHLFVRAPRADACPRDRLVVRRDGALVCQQAPAACAHRAPLPVTLGRGFSQGFLGRLDAAPDGWHRVQPVQ